MAFGDGSEPGHEPLGIGDQPDLHREAFELVVIVLLLAVMMRSARRDIVLGRRFETEQHSSVNATFGGRHHLGAARQKRGDSRARFDPFRLRHQIDLVQHDHVGAQQLIFEDLFERIVVIERGISGALSRQPVRVVGESPGSHSSAVDHRYDAIDGESRADRWPIESLNQRFWERQAGGLDHDMVGLLR